MSRAPFGATAARVLLAMLAVSACSGGTGTRGLAPSPGACALVDTDRSLLVAAGPSQNEASLARVDLCTRTVTPVPDTSRTSVVSSGGGLVVVANARGGPDALYQLKNERLVPLPGIGTPAGLAPSVSPDGRVSYVTLGPTRATGFRLHVWTPPRAGAAASDEVVFDADLNTPSIVSSWTPTGDLVLASNRERDGQPTGLARMLVLTRRGQVRQSIALTTPLVNQFLWTPHSTVIVGETDATGTQRSGAVLRTSDFRRIGSTPKGWAVLALSPSGRLLLLARDGRLGLADAAANDPLVQPVEGISLGQVVSGTWVPAI